MVISKSAPTWMWNYMLTSYFAHINLGRGMKIILTYLNFYVNGIKNENKNRTTVWTYFLPDVFESFNTFTNFFQTSFYFPWKQMITIRLTLAFLCVKAVRPEGIWGQRRSPISTNPLFQYHWSKVSSGQLAATHHTFYNLMLSWVISSLQSIEITLHFKLPY